MEKKVWAIIEETKEGKAYLPSEQQFQNLKNVLKRFSKEEVIEILDTWRELTRKMQNEEFGKLHIDNGGIVNGGDDGFYMDFGNWLLVQGEELYNCFFEEGHGAVLRYIKKHNIPEEDYRFECMIYAFSYTLNS